MFSDYNLTEPALSSRTKRLLEAINYRPERILAWSDIVTDSSGPVWSYTDEWKSVREILMVMNEVLNESRSNKSNDDD